MLPLNYFLFLQIVLFLFITPGTPRIVIISYSMNYGVQKCVWTALGDITANFIQGALVIFVLGSFFSDNPSFLNAFKWAGIIYLMYLAYDIYKSKLKDINSSQHQEKSIFSFFKDGFLVAFLSPKAWVFFGAIFPQFLNLEGDFTIQLVILIISWVILDFSTLMLYGFTAQKIISWLKTNPRTINTISACALIIIAIIIASTNI